MALGIKYFMLNRENDWRDYGYVYDLNFNRDFLEIPSNMKQPAFYISKTFDSLKLETCWHRFKIKTSIFENSIIRIHIFTSDDEVVSLPNFLETYPEGLSIEEYLKDEKIIPQDKINFIDAIGGKKYENYNDIELFDFKGRYMWFGIEILNSSDESGVIEELKIEFPKKSFVEYLPEIYQTNMGTNSFLERFVGVFQSLYLDLDDDIANVSSIFDPQTLDPEWLKCLSEWFAFEDSFLWEEKKLKKVLKEVISLYKCKGTKRVLLRIIELYTGEVPIIIERVNIEDTEFYKNDAQVLRKLYGKNGCFFCVFVSSEAIKTTNEYYNLMRIIDQFKPIDSICNLIVLNKDIYLDYHCYIGVNSQISGDSSMIIKNGQVSCAQGILI